MIFLFLQKNKLHNLTGIELPLFSVPDQGPFFSRIGEIHSHGSSQDLQNQHQETESTPSQIFDNLKVLELPEWSLLLLYKPNQFACLVVHKHPTYRVTGVEEYRMDQTRKIVFYFYVLLIRWLRSNQVDQTTKIILTDSRHCIVHTCQGF